MKVQLGVSNRHVHLCLEDFKLLFGEDSELEVVKELVQPGQFAISSFVTIKTAKSEFSKVRVIPACFVIGIICRYCSIQSLRSSSGVMTRLCANGGIIITGAPSATASSTERLNSSSASADSSMNPRSSGVCAATGSPASSQRFLSSAAGVSCVVTQSIADMPQSSVV